MVNVIFKELDVEALIEKIRNCGIISKALSFIKSNKIFVKATSLLLSGVIALVVTIVSVGITVGFNVKYSGKVIAEPAREDVDVPVNETLIVELYSK